VSRDLDPSPSGEPPDVLSVQVDGDRDEPTRLFVISRPERGVVRVREWTSEGWAGPPSERELPADELYALFERAQARRRRLSENLYRIRLWLAGSPAA